MARTAKKREPRAVAPKSRGKRKLTDAQVREIVASRNANTKMVEIAAHFAVTVSTISSIVNGRTYAWLTGIGVAPQQTAPAVEKVLEAA